MPRKPIARGQPAKMRRYYKRRRISRRKNNINIAFPGYSGVSPFPLHKFVKLKYSGVHTLAVGAAGILGSIQEYNLNSVYDPDETGGGHQCYGFDTMATIYSRYKVTGCKVEITFNDPTIDAMAIAYQLTNPSTASETIASLSPYQVQERQMGGTFTINNTGSQERKKRFYVPMWKASGLTKLQFDADPDNYTAGVGGDPGSKIQFQVACADIRGGSSGSVMYEIRLTYDVMFYQRKILPLS